MKQLWAIALLLPLVGCVQERSPVWIPSDIAPLFGGGGSAPAPARPAPGYNGQPLAPSADSLPMLQDPDAQKQEWTEDLWASNQDTAESRCQEIADRESAKGNPTVQLGRPFQVYQKPSKYGDYLFKCQFSTEVIGYTDDRRRH
jgi:hypothetical protein